MKKAQIAHLKSHFMRMPTDLFRTPTPSALEQILSTVALISKVNTTGPDVWGINPGVPECSSLGLRA